MAKFLDNPSCFSVKTVYGCERFILGCSFIFLASVFNIVHTFVCGDDAGPSTANANESISDGAVNVNPETTALTNNYIQIENALCIQIQLIQLMLSFQKREL